MDEFILNLHIEVQRFLWGYSWTELTRQPLQTSLTNVIRQQDRTGLTFLLDRHPMRHKLKLCNLNLRRLASRDDFLDIVNMFTDRGWSVDNSIRASMSTYCSVVSHGNIAMAFAMANNDRYRSLMNDDHNRGFELFKVTPINIAVSNGHLSMVKSMIRFGFGGDPDQQTRNGMLKCAILHKQLNVCLWILHNFKPDYDEGFLRSAVKTGEIRFVNLICGAYCVYPQSSHFLLCFRRFPDLAIWMYNQFIKHIEPEWKIDASTIVLSHSSILISWYFDEGLIHQLGMLTERWFYKALVSNNLALAKLIHTHIHIDSLDIIRIINSESSIRMDQTTLDWVIMNFPILLTHMWRHIRLAFRTCCHPTFIKFIIDNIDHPIDINMFDELSDFSHNQCELIRILHSHQKAMDFSVSFLSPTQLLGVAMSDRDLFLSLIAINANYVQSITETIIVDYFTPPFRSTSVAFMNVDNIIHFFYDIPAAQTPRVKNVIFTYLCRRDVKLEKSTFVNQKKQFLTMLIKSNDIVLTEENVDVMDIAMLGLFPLETIAPFVNSLVAKVLLGPRSSSSSSSSVDRMQWLADRFTMPSDLLTQAIHANNPKMVSWIIRSKLEKPDAEHIQLAKQLNFIPCLFALIKISSE